jgi:ParB-like chromosome segregation protein Spo0J
MRSIAEIGLIDPIVLFQGQVLDGWQRELACRETGTTPRYEEFAGDCDGAIRYAISANVKRQHLNESQRAMVAAKLAQP